MFQLEIVKMGFGWHSLQEHIVLLWRMARKACFRAIRNYLDFPEQQRLSEILSGKAYLGMSVN